MLSILNTVHTVKARIVAVLRKLSACLPRVSKAVDEAATELEKN
jgi:hypothetical protein